MLRDNVCFPGRAACTILSHGVAGLAVSMKRLAVIVLAFVDDPFGLLSSAV